MLNHVKLIHTVYLLLLIFVITGCGGGGGTTTTSDGGGGGTVFTAESKSQAVGPAGGSFTQQLADGTSFQVDIPAGALPSSTTLTLTTQKPASGQKFNLLLQPAGLVLANGAVATITISLPPGQTLPSTGALIYDNTFVPFTTLPDGRLQVALSAFAGASTSQAPKAGSLLNLFSAKANAAASTATCGNVPYMETNEGLAAVDAVDIEIYGQCMVAAVQALAEDEQFEEALHTINSVASYLQATGSGNADTFITQAQGIACTAYGIDLDRGREVSVNDMDTLYDIIEPIMFWEAVVQGLGVTCYGIAADDYQTVVHAKIGEAINYYEQVAPNLTSTSSPSYADAKAEAADSARTKNEVLALNPPPAVRQTVTSEITERAQPGLLDAMLQAPWDRCRNTANYDELAYLMTTMDNPDSVKTAAQYCGSVLEAQTKNSSGTVTDQLAQPLGGVSASEKRTSGSIKADKTGTISLSGPIQALQCPDNYFYAGGSESLTIKLDGTTIQTLDSPPYLNNALVIDIATALEAAHPGNTANLTQATLTIERTGAPCNGFWGSNPSPMLTLTLSMAQPKIAFSRAAGTNYGDIYVMNSDGSGITQLTSGTENDISPAWSPDRSRIVFARGVSGVYNIYIMNADGSNVVKLTTTSIGYANPAWSPDGAKILFQGYDGSHNSHIYVMNADGSGITQLTTIGEGNNDPAWSPDGAKIVFSNDDRYAGAGAGIYIMNSDGSGLSKLTDSNSSPQDYAPSWSPDGAKIAFSRDGSIYVMNADGSGQKQITTGATDASPDWSPDGAKITFTRYSEGNIYIMNSDGSDIKLLTNGYWSAW